MGPKSAPATLRDASLSGIVSEPTPAGWHTSRRVDAARLGAADAL